MAERAPDKPDAAALLARLDTLRQAERRAASARMVSVAGHLIGTPLNVIAGRAALIRSNPAPEAVEENVRRIEEQVERLALRIRRLIDYFGMADPSDARIAEVAGMKLQVSAQGVDPLRIEASVPPLVLTTLLSLAIRSSGAGKTVQLTATEHGPKTIVFELTLPDLPAPPANFERLEPPEHSLRYDAGALETFWICLGLARRIGGTLSVEKAAGPVGVTVRFECAHG
jgi:hypothetical protein